MFFKRQKGKYHEVERVTRFKLIKSGKHWLRAATSQFGLFRSMKGGGLSSIELKVTEEQVTDKKSGIDFLRGIVATGAVLGGAVVTNTIVHAEEGQALEKVIDTTDVLATRGETVLGEESSAAEAATATASSHTESESVSDTSSASASASVSASISASISASESMSQSSSASISASTSQVVSDSLSVSESLSVSSSTSDSVSASTSASASASESVSASQTSTTSTSESARSESSQQSTEASSQTGRRRGRRAVTQPNFNESNRDLVNGDMIDNITTSFDDQTRLLTWTITLSPNKAQTGNIGALVSIGEGQETTSVTFNGREATKAGTFQSSGNWNLYTGSSAASTTLRIVTRVAANTGNPAIALRLATSTRTITTNNFPLEYRDVASKTAGSWDKIDLNTNVPFRDEEDPQVKSGDYVVYRGESFEFYAEITDNSGQVNDVVVRNVEVHPKTKLVYLSPDWLNFSTDNLGQPGNATAENPLRTKLYGNVPLDTGLGFYTRYIVATDPSNNTTKMIQNPNRDRFERFVLTVKSQNEKYDPADPTVTYVNNLSNLSQTERNAVAAAVRAANPDIPAAATISVSANGTVTITYPDKSKDTISADRVVKDLASSRSALTSASTSASVSASTSASISASTSASQSIVDSKSASVSASTSASTSASVSASTSAQPAHP